MLPIFDRCLMSKTCSFSTIPTLKLAALLEVSGKRCTYSHRCPNCMYYATEISSLLQCCMMAWVVFLPVCWPPQQQLLDYAHAIVDSEQAAGSFASGHSPVFSVNQPKVSELIQSRLAKERQLSVAMHRVSFLKKEAMHTIRRCRSSQQLFGFIGTRRVQRWSMSVVEVNHLKQSSSSASAKHQRLQMHLKVVRLDRHDMKSISQASFLHLMSIQIMRYFIQIVSINQLTIKVS